MRLKGNLAADGALVLTTLIWGSTFVMARDVLDHWPPVAYITFRFVLAALAFLALFPKRVAEASRAEWGAGALLGLLVGAGFAVQAVGQVYTSPSKSAFITGLTTPLVPFVAFLLLRSRPSRENFVGVVLASVGGALVLAPQGDVGVNRGDVITLGCTLLFAAHIVFMSVYARRHDVRRLAVIQIVAAAALMTLVWLALRAYGLLTDPGSLPPWASRELVALSWNARVVWQLLYLAFVATLATFLLWTWGQSRVSATHAAIIFSLEPVFATLFAVLVRGSGEWMGGRANVGALLILAGVIISELRWGEDKSARDAGVEDAREPV